MLQLNGDVEGVFDPLVSRVLSGRRKGQQRLPTLFIMFIFIFLLFIFRITIFGVEGALAQRGRDVLESSFVFLYGLI